MTPFPLHYYNTPYKFKTQIYHSTSSLVSCIRIWGWGLRWSSAFKSKELSNWTLLCWISLTLSIVIHLSACSATSRRQRQAWLLASYWLRICVVWLTLGSSGPCCLTRSYVMKALFKWIVAVFTEWESLSSSFQPPQRESYVRRHNGIMACLL